MCHIVDVGRRWARVCVWGVCVRVVWVSESIYDFILGSLLLFFLQLAVVALAFVFLLLMWCDVCVCLFGLQAKPPAGRWKRWQGAKWGASLPPDILAVYFTASSCVCGSTKIIWTVRLCIDLFMCACLCAGRHKSDSKCVRAAQYECLPCECVCVCMAACVCVLWTHKWRVMPPN